MSLIGLLVVLLVFCVIAWAARSLMGAFGIGDPIATIVYVIIVLVFVLWVLQNVGMLSGGPVLRVR